jgi:hypothetical protein
MNPCLKGTPVPPAGSVIYPLSPEIKKLRGLHDLQTYYPGLGIFCNLQKPPSEDIWFNHAHRVIGTKESEDSVSKSSGWIDLRVEQNKLTSGVDIQDISGFRKITHLLDPTSWIQGKYSLPKNTKLFVRLMPNSIDIKLKTNIFQFSYNMNQIRTVGEMLNYVS